MPPDTPDKWARAQVFKALPAAARTSDEGRRAFMRVVHPHGDAAPDCSDGAVSTVVSALDLS